MADEPLRLAKFMARSGLDSRRACELLIKNGKIKVNGVLCKNPATHVTPGKDKVFMGRRRIQMGAPKGRDESELFIAYKPVGMVTTMKDPEGRPTVADLLPDRTVRLFPVGRLDFDAEGALLFTDDGELVQRLTHPRFHAPKLYLVKVKGEPTDQALDKLRKGVRLDDGKTKPCSVLRVSKAKKNTWVEIELTEGRYRQIKRMFWKIRHPVMRLVRVSVAGISAEGMEAGAVRLCTEAERELAYAWADGALAEDGKN
jgi:23S rRNA pseudouridine2605 synthase